MEYPDFPFLQVPLAKLKEARFALRGFTQPLGIAEYETQKLFAEVASSLPQIEDIEQAVEDEQQDATARKPH